MKKIVALMIAVLGLAGAASALDLEVGAKFNLGRDLEEGIFEFAKNTAESKSLDMDSDFMMGGSAYVHAAIFPFLGVQIEPTVFKSSIKITGDSVETTQKFDSLVLDIPVMYWNSIKIWRLGLGVGIGMNFSTDLNRTYGSIAKDLIDDPKSFAWGFVTGADVKLYLTDNIGIVGSARYLMDLSTKEVPVVVGDIDTGASYNTIEIGRKLLYGSVGLEYKFF